jgi:hypothetical protein
MLQQFGDKLRAEPANAYKLLKEVDDLLIELDSKHCELDSVPLIKILDLAFEKIVKLST